MLPQLLLIPFISVVTGQLTDGCYPVPPNSTGGPLTVIKTGKTPNGFRSAARGWNSWGVQASPGTTPSYGSTLSSAINQSFVIEQCSVLADPNILAAGYRLCSIDAYWDSSVTDDYGRVVWNSTSFDIPELASYLHGIGLQLGIYYTPGIPCDATNKTIYGTNITIGSTFNGVVDTNDHCYFDYDNPDTQLYHDSLLALWASWGIDMIKLDFITPGSIVGSLGMPSNVSSTALAYHQAIANSGRQIRLDLSSNVCRDEPYLGIWEASAESMRVAIDINSYGDPTFVGMWLIQNTIEQYRQYINLLVYANATMTLHPDMDDLFVGNPANVTGVTDGQRITLMSHWIGASANLILGSDMTNLDALGKQLITSGPSVAAANFCSKYPMQPRNPGTGSNQAMQLQAWVAGPDDDGQAYVLLTNLGPNQGKGGYVDVGSGEQNVTATLTDLGLTGTKYSVTDVWFGNVTTVETGEAFSAVLDEGASRFLHLSLV